MALYEEEGKPFLTDDQGHDDVDHRDNPATDNSQARKLFRVHGLLSAFHLVFLSLNVFYLFKTTTSWDRDVVTAVRRTKQIDIETFSPARSAIEYAVREFHYYGGPNPFTGPPRPEFDQAWSKLLRSSTSMLSEDEMRRMNKTSIMLQDGSGYIGYLEAIHMLHCVKRIYQLQHPEHYPELQDGDAFTTHHLDHCLEILRQGIMCNADVTVNTYYWEKPGKIKGNRSGARKCTDWDRLQEWSDQRTVVISEEAKLVDVIAQKDETGSVGPLT
ncbi:hypothetical protein QBC35DRAFT_471745 [Podospora australis]|uniref:Tat pathway signal sequence n=1 Tax=Podospora australis TaxID=1536484 RepID=A0AAN6WZN3_9PEZI|nr:hypothetical protein QBC35DRAFT_471745 [Podospora australis]